MRRTAAFRSRSAGLAAALLIPGLWACDGQLAEPTELQTRIFRVTQADGQLLPAHHACPAPEEGMTAGARFLEGELILYPERIFTWRYTVEQYAASDDQEQSWTAPVFARGTYALRGDLLELATDAGVTRSGRVRGDVVELTESVPCHFSGDAQAPHDALLQLEEVDEGA